MRYARSGLSSDRSRGARRRPHASRHRPENHRPPRSRTWSSSAGATCRARSAYQPLVHKQGDRFIAYIGHHGGRRCNPLTGKHGRQRHVDRRRHQPEAAEIPRAHSGRAGQAEAGRRADGPRVRRQRAAARGQEQGLPAAQLRQHRPTKSGTSPIRRSQPPDRRRQRTARHAQELVGMRHRHRATRLPARPTGARGA